MEGRSLKLVSYNILNGGLGRLDPIYETLLDLDGDIVGLCEAGDFTAVRYLAEKLRMDFVVGEGAGRNAVALLCRPVVRRMVNLFPREPKLDRGAIEVQVGCGREVLRVVVAHLEAGQHRANEAKRLEQAGALLEGLRREPMPTVLMGDFNAAAPYHPFDFQAASPKVRRRLEERGTRRLDHDVVEAITAAGWVDAYHRARPDQPVHTYTTGFPCSRFDYIWVSPDLAERVQDAGVERGGFAPYCSDHFPIWARLRL